MDALAAAVMVLLTCSSDSCREARVAQAYSSIEACRAALPTALREMNADGRQVIGRCETGRGIDPITTGLIDDTAIVRVTRIDDGEASTSTYRVPRSRPITD